MPIHHCANTMVLLIISLFLIVVIYYYGTRHYSYWGYRNIKYNNPLPFFGNNLKGYTMQASSTQIATELYKQYPREQVVGFYRGRKPELLVRDPDVIRHVLAADFQYFHDRGFGKEIEVEPLLNNLFSAEGDLWKLLRQRLTPAFSSGRLRNMFPLILECTQKLQEQADFISRSCEPYDVRELMAGFTTDVIGTCGFGIKMAEDASTKFRDIGRRIIKITPFAALRMILKDIFPHYFRHLKLFEQSVEDDIMNIVKEISEQRNGVPIGRNDFIDLLLDLKQQGKMVSESMQEKYIDGTPKKVVREMDLTLMAAQCFVFLAAGFETSSSSASFALHELAFNPEIQLKSQKEIDQVLKKHCGNLSYDAISEMKYLEAVFKEAMRKFPPLGILNRTCTKVYNIPGTNIWIDKGVTVVIPVSALHNDKQYYQNPDNFDPTRFTHEDDKRPKFSYLPFGEGPRACIGSRLGLMQSLVGLATVLSRYSVTPAATSRRQLQIDPFSNVVQSVKGGMMLILKKRSL